MVVSTDIRNPGRDRGNVSFYFMASFGFYFIGLVLSVLRFPLCITPHFCLSGIVSSFLPSLVSRALFSQRRKKRQDLRHGQRRRAVAVAVTL